MKFSLSFSILAEAHFTFQVQGYVYDRKENKVATLFGKWDEAMYFIMGDIATRSRTFDPMTEAILLWRRNDPPEFPTRYNLTSFAITLNEIMPGLKVFAQKEILVLS